MVVTDIVVPDLDGTSPIVELERRYPRVKIVAVSGAGRTRYVDYLRMAAEMGAHRTLAKPLDVMAPADCIHGPLGSVPPPAAAS